MTRFFRSLSKARRPAHSLFVSDVTIMSWYASCGLSHYLFLTPFGKRTQPPKRVYADAYNHELVDTTIT